MKRISFFLLALLAFASLLLPAVAGVPGGTWGAGAVALATIPPTPVAFHLSPPPAAAPTPRRTSVVGTVTLGRCASTTQPPGRALTSYQHNLRVALTVERRCEGRVYS